MSLRGTKEPCRHAIPASVKSRRPEKDESTGQSRRWAEAGEDGVGLMDAIPSRRLA